MTSFTDYDSYDAVALDELIASKQLYGLTSSCRECGEDSGELEAVSLGAFAYAANLSGVQYPESLSTAAFLNSMCDELELAQTWFTRRPGIVAST